MNKGAVLYKLRAIRYRAVRPLLNPIEGHYEKKFLTASRMCRMDEVAPDDIFIVAYPKSGVTWFQNLVVGLMLGCDLPSTPDTVIQSIVPDRHWLPYYRRYGTPMVFKSHELPRAEFRRVVHLVRDGRDVAVSFRHFARAMGWDSKQAGWTAIAHDWQHHLRRWQENPFRADVLTVRYEDLHRDAIAEMGRFASFAGVDRDDGALRRAVDGASFRNLRTREDVQGLANPVWPRNERFFRRGATGSFESEMPRDALRAFEEIAGETLERWGYARSVPL